MPWRYAPLVAEHRIVRVDLPCSPCNRIRSPPSAASDTRPTASLASPPRWSSRRRASLLASTLATRAHDLARRSGHPRRASAPVSGALSVDALIAPGDAERAEADANRWIKSLRHARVDGADVPRSVHAIAATRSGGSPSSTCTSAASSSGRSARCMPSEAALAKAPSRAWDLSGADHVVAHVAAEVAPSTASRARASAVAPRVRIASRRPPKPSFTRPPRWRIACACARAPPAAKGGVAAFVHSAFARGGRRRGGLHRAGASRHRAARRRRPPVAGRPRPSHELQGARLARSAPRVRRSRLPRTRRDARGRVLADGASSHRRASVWRNGRQVAKALTGSHDLREAAAIDGCDLWPLVSPELEGIADAAVPLVGPRHGRSRRGPRSRFRRTSWSRTPRPVGGAARWCWSRDDGPFPLRRHSTG